MIHDFDSLFDIITFPSGETHVRAKDSFPKQNDYIIKRCYNWNDIIHLILANKILKRSDIKCEWVIPFKPFARQDRITGSGHSCETYTLNRILRDDKIDVTFLDVHSDVKTCDIRKESEHYLAESNLKFGNIKQSVIFKKLCDEYSLVPTDIIAPDEGSKSKIKAIGGQLIHQCSKVRDSVTGKLTKFEIPKLSSSPNYIIVDDICDGGGTFLGIADEVLTQKPEAKLDLYVTHGIFSKGFDELLKRFNNIYTTNSFRTDIVHDRVFVLDIKELL